MTASGNAQIDTAQSVFGGASGLFDGNQDFVYSADHADWDFGTSPFTIDFRIRFNTATGSRMFVTHGGTGIDVVDVTGWAFFLNGGTSIWFRYHDGGATNFSASWTPSANTWYHIALTRDSSNDMRLFVDGTQVGTTQSFGANIANGTDQLRVGIANSSDDGGDFDGWMDELRIVKGEAVWTSNFTPPSGEYSP